MTDVQSATQRILDLSKRILDPEAEDPTPEEIYEATKILHSIRGEAQANKVSKTKTIDLAALFGKTEEKKDE